MILFWVFISFIYLFLIEGCLLQFVVFVVTSTWNRYREGGSRLRFSGQISLLLFVQSKEPGSFSLVMFCKSNIYMLKPLRHLPVSLAGDFPGKNNRVVTMPFAQGIFHYLSSMFLSFLYAGLRGLYH